jgi:hypothetical protein
MAPIKVMDMKYAERMADDAQVQVLTFLSFIISILFLEYRKWVFFITSEGQL